MNDYQAKQEARRERLENAADKARQRSDAAHKASHAATDGIPFGQPILVGHHSEGRHRRALDRSWSQMGKAVAEDKKAKEFDRKAAGVGTGGVSSDDPEAISQLRAKVEKLERDRELMKKGNKAYAMAKKRGVTRESDIAEINAIGEAVGLVGNPPSALLMGAITYEPQWSKDKPFSYQLTNLGANIRSTKKRIEQLLALASRTDSEYTINGTRIVENATENRVQMFFDGKPHESVRKILKSYGFRWARSIGCWQMHYSNQAIYRAKAVAAIED